MRSNGFTLIELLAVIVILAIISLIAIPIVIHIIDDSKKSSWNICESGILSTENNKCTCAWYEDSDSNNYGPITAMQVLHNATKDWINVPDIVVNYTDENNTDSDTYGYKSIITDLNTKTTTIIGKPQTNIAAIGNNINPLKARLPMELEVANTGYNGGYASCPKFLVENLDLDNIPSYKSGAIEKYSTLSRIPGIIGYWLLSSNNGDSMKIEYDGSKGSGYTVYSNLTTDYGFRPVITIPISDLN